MANALQLATVMGFAVMMTAAAVTDLRRLVIPNRLILGLLLLWPLRLAVSPALSLPSGLGAAAGALAVFLCGALLFSRGWVGGGDVKLLTVAALWAGADRLPTLLLVTGLMGGALSVLSMTPIGGLFGAARRGAAAAAGTVNVVPYGAAIAGAALAVVLPSQWS